MCFVLFQSCSRKIKGDSARRLSSEHLQQFSEVWNIFSNFRKFQNIFGNLGNMERVAKGFCVTCDGPKISSVMRDGGKISRVMRDWTSQHDA